MTARDPENLSEIDDIDEVELERRLRAAYGPGAGCPPPESWHRAALGELAPDERARLAAHAAGCPACAAERELAAAFAAGPDPAAADDVAAVVARLAARPPHRSAAGVAAAETARDRSAAEPLTRTPEPPDEHPAGAPPAVRPAGRLLRFPRLAGAPAAVLAAAAALVLALGLGTYVLRSPQPPPLPDRPAGGAVRGAVVTGLAPSGEVDSAPAALTWEPVAGAARYRVTLLAVDDAVLWRGETAGPPATLPDAVMPLSSAVVYGWSVEALDAGGRLLARSERAGFRIRPEPEAAPATPPAGESEG